MSNVITKKKKIEPKKISDFAHTEKNIQKKVESREGVRKMEVGKINNDNKNEGLKDSFINPWNIPFSSLFDNFVIENFRLKETIGMFEKKKFIAIV